MSTHPDDKIDHVCELCGLVWITRGAPSSEGTVRCIQRCYCHVDYSMSSLDAAVIKLEDLDEQVT